MNRVKVTFSLNPDTINTLKGYLGSVENRLGAAPNASRAVDAAIREYVFIRVDAQMNKEDCAKKEAHK